MVRDSNFKGRLNALAIRRGRRALLLGASAMLLVAGALFPIGCTTYDGPPGSEPSGAVCPEGATVIGIEWPNMYLGFVAAPVTGVLVGFVTVVAVRRGRENSHPE